MSEEKAFTKTVELLNIQELSNYWWVVVIGSIFVGQGLLQSDSLTLLGVAGGMALGIHSLDSNNG